jgi:hypothetical protein
MVTLNPSIYHRVLQHIFISTLYKELYLFIHYVYVHLFINVNIYLLMVHLPALSVAQYGVSIKNFILISKLHSFSEQTRIKGSKRVFSHLISSRIASLKNNHTQTQLEKHLRSSKQKKKFECPLWGACTN